MELFEFLYIPSFIEVSLGSAAYLGKISLSYLRVSCSKVIFSQPGLQALGLPITQFCPSPLQLFFPQHPRRSVLILCEKIVISVDFCVYSRRPGALSGGWAGGGLFSIRGLVPELGLLHTYLTPIIIPARPNNCILRIQ